MKIKHKKKWTEGWHVAIVATGLVWNFHWMEGIDFSHLMVVMSTNYHID